MLLEHEFTVPVPVETAWPVLLDIERIAPCLPGATLTKIEGRDVEGKVRIRVGPITVTYNGSASFAEVQETARRVIITAKGKEARGPGTANATVTAQLYEDGDTTRVSVQTDLAVTGRPAQFGRGVLGDVGGKLLDKFAACLAERLAEEGTSEPAAEVPPEPAQTAAESGTPPQAAEPVPATASVRTDRTGQSSTRSAATSRALNDEPIDLFGEAGGPLLRRYAPHLAALLAFVLVFALLRHRRR